MKLRNLLMTAVFILTVAVSVVSKAMVRRVSCFQLVSNQCVGGSTLQSNCSVLNTGPACTVSDGVSTAYAVKMPVCTVVLRQP